MQANQLSDGRTIPTRTEIDPFVAACIQAAPVNFDSEKTLEKVRVLAADAAGMHAKVILFPQAFIGGYPRGASFRRHGRVADARRRDQLRLYHAAAIDIPGPASEA